MGDRYVTEAGGLSASQKNAARFESAEAVLRARKGARAVRLSSAPERDVRAVEALRGKGYKVTPPKPAESLPVSAVQVPENIRDHKFFSGQKRPEASEIRAWIRLLQDDADDVIWHRWSSGAYDVQATYFGGPAFDSSLVALAKAPIGGVMRFFYWVANPSEETLERTGLYKTGSKRFLPKDPDDLFEPPAELVKVFSTYTKIENAEELLSELEIRFEVSEEGETLDPDRLGFQVFYGPLERPPRKRKKRGRK